MKIGSHLFIRPPHFGCTVLRERQRGAATINAAYSFSQTITGDPTNPPLLGNGSGSLSPFGSMTWSDRAFPNLATGDFTGTFAMEFANGSLFGSFSGTTDLNAPLKALPITQVLNVTGGTGMFAGYTGLLTGGSVLNLLTLEETASGSGSLNDAVPEPEAVTLLATGLLSLVAVRKFFGKARGGRVNGGRA